MASYYQEKAGAPASYEGQSAGRYLATRISSLKPPLHKIPNPFKALGLLNKQQWLFFLVRRDLFQSDPLAVPSTDYD